VVVKIDNDIDFHGNFNDIVKVNKWLISTKVIKTKGE
jgi:hypothetical protein